jgi:hypothetical protein
MDSIKDALLKVGIDNIKIQKQKSNIIKLDKEEYKIFNQMHQDPKRRKFLLHLVHAFLPNIKENSVDHIWSWKGIKGERRCVFCEQLLTSIADSYVKINSKIDEKFIYNILMIESNNINIFSEINNKIDTTLNSLFPNEKYLNAFSNKVSGIYSKKSKVFICSPCYKLFNNWIANMLVRRHNDMKYIIGDKIKV